MSILCYIYCKQGAGHQEPAGAAAAQARQGVQRQPGPVGEARQHVQGGCHIILDYTLLYYIILYYIILYYIMIEFKPSGRGTRQHVPVTFTVESYLVVLLLYYIII